MEFNICNVEVTFRKSLTPTRRVQGSGSTFAVGEKKRKVCLLALHDRNRLIRGKKVLNETL